MSQDTDQKEAENVVKMAGYMRRSRFVWFWYALMRALMLVEGVLWTGMDAVRAVRMRVAGKINRNYQQFNDR